ncbi:MAG: aldose 1-epimerase family protein [Candidatus Limivivens sp.]|nr:aldose 1-epimerase family protein [Candidatus Limivivens sp.]
MNQMENETLLVEISDHGAELSRIYRKDTGREVLWNADPAFWNRHAPVLFPFVGASNEGVYHYQGREYPMKQHGFARDLEFELVSAGENQVVHRLESSEKTREQYPFDFCLTITHRLEGNRITVGWKVENRTEGILYFTIGAHPAFNVEKGSYLVTEGHEELKFIRINEPGTALPEVYTLKLPGGRLQMPENMFDEGVYIFEDGQLDRVGLAGPDGAPIVTVSCPGFPYVGVWAKPGSSFVCLEPWYGRTDDTGYTGDLSGKTGVQKLEKDGVFEVSYEIVIG